MAGCVLACARCGRRWRAYGERVNHNPAPVDLKEAGRRLAAGRRLRRLEAGLHGARRRVRRSYQRGDPGRADAAVLPQPGPQQVADQLREPPGRLQGCLARDRGRAAQSKPRAAAAGRARNRAAQRRQGAAGVDWMRIGGHDTPATPSASCARPARSCCCAATTAPRSCCRRPSTTSREARAALRAFLADNLKAVEAALAHAAGAR
jgi:hypothetical protein